MSQVKLVNSQIARILSDRAKERSRSFKRLQLLAAEREKYNAYRQKDVSTLTDSELVEFQKIYYKKRMAEAINRALYSTTLKFAIDLRDEVKAWLIEYGYSLAPTTPTVKSHSQVKQYTQSVTESASSYYELRW